MGTRAPHLASWIMVVLMAQGCGEKSEPSTLTPLPVQVAAMARDAESEPAGPSILDEMDLTLGKGGAARSSGSAPGKHAPTPAAPRSTPKTGAAAPGKTPPKSGGAGSAKPGPKAGVAPPLTRGAAKPGPRTGGTAGGANPATGNTAHGQGSVARSPSRPAAGRSVVAAPLWTPPYYRNVGGYLNYSIAWFFQWAYQSSGTEDAGRAPGQDDDTSRNP